MPLRAVSLRPPLPPLSLLESLAPPSEMVRLDVETSTEPPLSVTETTVVLYTEMAC